MIDVGGSGCKVWEFTSSSKEKIKEVRWNEYKFAKEETIHKVIESETSRELLVKTHNLRLCICGGLRSAFAKQKMTHHVKKYLEVVVVHL